MQKINSLVAIFKSVFRYNSDDWNSLETKIAPLESELLGLSINDSDLSDEQAAHELLRTDLKDPNFRRLKLRLRDKLFLEVLNFNPSSSKYYPYQKQYFRSQQLYGAFNILRALGQQVLSKYLAVKLNNVSRTYGFNEILFETNKFLFKYYSVFHFNKQKSIFFLNESILIWKVFQRESEIEIEYYRVLSDIQNKIDTSGDLLKETEVYIKRLRPHIGCNSIKFHLFYFHLGTIVHQAKSENEIAMKFAREGYDFFQNLDFDHKSGKRLFIRELSNGYLNLGYLLEAKQAIQKSLELENVGCLNWMNSKSLLVQIECQLLNFNEAWSQVENVCSHESLNDLPTANRFLIEIQEIYLLFLVKNGRIEETVSPSRYKKSVIPRIDHYPNLGKTHKISISLINLLFRIHYREYVEVEGLLVELQSYTGKNLVKTNPNYRVHCLIKMIALIPENRYNAISVKRKAAKYLNKMKEVPLKMSQGSAENEIIPFDYLWGVVLDDLANGKKYRAKASKASAQVIR